MNDEKDLTVDQTFNLAVRNHQNSNFQDAQNYYQKVLKIDPNHSAALNNLGAIYQSIKDHQKAKDCYEKAIEINPNYADAYNNLGLVFQGLAEYQKAKSCYEKAIEINPNYVGAHNNLGVIFKELEENQKAKSCYEKAIEIDSNYVAAHNNLGVVFKELEENQKAKECFKKAIEVNPGYLDAHNNLGVIFKELDENQKAKECFEKVIEINSDHVNAHFNLGVIFKELAENQKAKKCFEKVIEFNSNYSEAHNNLGNVFKDLGNLQKAEECYEKAIKLKPDFKDAHDNLDYLLKEKRLLTKIGKIKNSDNKTKISFFKKNTTKSFLSNLRLTSNPFISNRKVEAELISQLYKINSEKLDDAMPKHLHYGNGKTSDYNLFENDFSIIKNVEKDLTNIMSKAVKSDIFIIESFFNIFQKGSGVVPHNHLTNFDYNFGLINQKYSLTYYLDIGDQNCSEPGALKLQDPDKEILPSEGMILIFPASRNHSAIYNGRKDRVMIGINFYSFI